MIRSRRLAAALLLIALISAASSSGAAAQAAAQPQPERADPDARVDPLQPDFALAALPTTLRMPSGKWYFRVTHRFTRPLNQGDFGDLVGDAFGFDSSAQIGLELRFGLLPGTQIGAHRTSDRTIEIFGQHSVLSERHEGAFGLDVIGGLEGENNMRARRKGFAGLVLSKNLLRRVALYAQPIWVGNTNAFAGDDYSVLLGIGGRVRVLPSLYLLAEVTPRIAGHDPGPNQFTFALDGRAGGHLFQINVSNGFGTTLGQLAGGGISREQWYLGFNLARKFF